MFQTTNQKNMWYKTNNTLVRLQKRMGQTGKEIGFARRIPQTLRSKIHLTWLVDGELGSYDVIMYVYIYIHIHTSLINQ